MIKFSIIIPVYNTGIYLKKCLDSVFNQSFKDFEVIVIDDGSTDDSMDIVSDYNCIIIENDKKTIGPSRARNLGVSKAKGDYILFLDSDDYYEEDLLLNISNSLDKNYDIVRFEIRYDGIDKTLVGCGNNLTFDNGVAAFDCICKSSIVESPCCYAYNRNYFLKNDFKFKEGMLHEDFGLIPLVILKSTSFKCLDYVGYNYVIHENSIMSSNSYDKVLKKANDFLEHYKYLSSKCKEVNGDLSIFRSYIANSIIIKSTTLKGKDYKKYLKKLRRLNVFDMILVDTLSRKIKKFLISISPKLYYKVVR